MLGILPSSTDPNVSKPDRKLAIRQKRAMEFNQRGSTTTSPEEPPMRIPSKKRKLEASDSRGVAENLRNLANTSATVTGSLPVEDSKAKKRKAAKEQYKKDVANPSFITEFGPLPTNKDLFRGYGFIITFGELQPFINFVSYACARKIDTHDWTLSIFVISMTLASSTLSRECTVV